MADDVGTTYFSYRGPSPHELSMGNGSQSGHRNTIRSVNSGISSRGDNNEITTLAVRPYQDNAPEAPSTTSQSVLLLTPPYPGHLPYLAPPYSHFDSLCREGGMEERSTMSRRAHPDFTKGTETLRQCVFLMGFVFLASFGVAIFMAVYYGNNYHY